MPNMTKNALETYKDAVSNYFSFLKNTTYLTDLHTKIIPLKNNQGYLLPVCELHEQDEELIQQMAAWRKKHLRSFPTQFTVTTEGTKNWLRNALLNVPDRILFLVLSPQGKALGHLGFANGLNEEQTLEIDNVVRGVDTAHPGIMSLALARLIDWAEEYIAPQQIILRVFNDNSHAIDFYKKLGFLEDSLIPLKREEDQDKISYRPLLDSQEIPDKYFLKMYYEAKPITEAKELISTAGPSISARELSYAFDAAQNGWNAQWNKYIKRFEQSFSHYLGVKHSLSTSSCTGALHIALAALGIGAGDEVIVPDTTWVATANAVVYVGATPIFADIDKHSWCMDPHSFEQLINPRTKAVIAVHLYGHPAPIDTLLAIARKHNLYLIEDAAPSIGAEWKGQKVGTFGDFATFSFQGAKLAVTGEGGMLVTNNDALYEKAYAIWDQGREPNTFWIKQNGLKYKMSNIQAALGLGQLEHINELIHAKRRIFSWYSEFLEGVCEIQLNYELKDAYSIYWMSSILLKENTLTRDQLAEQLKKYNIDTRPVFPAISQYPHWPKAQAPQANARFVGENAINLPSGVRLKKEQIEYICRSLKKILLETNARAISTSKEVIGEHS
jgi:perosamine synthetase